jgi:hypothetical protein
MKYAGRKGSDVHDASTTSRRRSPVAAIIAAVSRA